MTPRAQNGPGEARAAPGEVVDRLRADARAFFDAGVAAADPARAVRHALEGEDLGVAPPGRLALVAFGKAAAAMLGEALKHVPAGTRTTALAITNPENVAEVPGAEVLRASHPVPDADGLAAGRRVARLAGELGSDDRLVVLISGGGSALLPCPPEGVSLEDKIALTGQLLGSGADITEVNTVRQGLSRLKGGGLARLAAPAPVLALILSDVPGDDLAFVASGPTVRPQTDPGAARAVLKRYDLWQRAPGPVRAHLAAQAENAARDDTDGFEHVRNRLVGGNSISVDAVAHAAQELYRVERVTDWLDGDVEDAAALLLATARRSAPTTAPLALICGGETTVILKGDGRGGRNQELALRFALKAEACDLATRLGAPWVFLSGGTDGRDGPTDAAGAIVDSHTPARMRAAGTNPEALLANNDAYAALAASRDLVMTGGTGTNVADIQILLIAPCPLGRIDKAPAGL